MALAHDLVTSLTTAAAFLSNGMSEIVPIKIFGIFMVRPKYVDNLPYQGAIVLINFFLCVTFYPAIIVLWYKNFSHKCCCYPDYPAFVDMVLIFLFWKFRNSESGTK